MGIGNRTVAVALAAAFILAGCGKPKSQFQPVADESTTLATADATLSASSAEPSLGAVTNHELLAHASNAVSESATGPGAATADRSTSETSPESTVAVPGAVEPNSKDATNETLSGGAEFMRKSLASPFAQAAQALKESYDSALVAVQIGDYERAVTELKALAESSDLTAEQEQAVRDLLEQALKEASELAPRAGTGTPQ